MRANHPSISLPNRFSTGSSSLTPIPLVDVQLQHQPLLYDLEQAMRQVWQQGDFVLGRAIEEFESTFAHACGVGQAVGVASGTDAIMLGLRACGIGSGDDVLVSAQTFIGTVLGVLATGAHPVFVDCDRETGLMDLTAAEKAITTNTRAIIPSHLYGQMVSPHRLLDLASTYDLSIFEDATEAHLAEREGYIAGTVGMAAAFDFYPTHNLGAFGDGGIVVTQDAQIAEGLRKLRNYGSSRQHVYTEMGLSSRLDTMQAAILQVKLPHLSRWNSDRLHMANAYNQRLRSLQPFGIVPLTNQAGSGHVYHRYVIRVTETCPLSRTFIQTSLSAVGIETGIHYPEICPLQPALHFLEHEPGNFPIAEAFSQEVLSLPLYPGLTEQQIDRVVDTLVALFNAPRPTASHAQVAWE
ncbi:DegT/DnrJ/EryC1/StrS family aminotransferase [Vacuolonema iberomarrocanum]|uniref:DegT/DnrJ/EryC1/StrS family aminotransferase n=1 Tax=Vacuolonema iberomarrocanum TaxID=3454632 RepID=UPI001A084192|nr:DegT/DnrJ/EryC1/StrS family aminotransferase [filamentous cyanobacterium LEGE 07170]